jgi:hypothetical protein
LLQLDLSDHPETGSSTMLTKLLVKLSSVVAISSACGLWKVW